MRNVFKWAVAAIAVGAVIAGAAGCEKNKEEAEKFPSATPLPPIVGGPLSSFRMDNGITVYLREEHSRGGDIAVEVLYGAGLMNEGPDKAQESRILAHMMIFSPTASYGPDEAVQAIQKSGKVNGEVTGYFTHFDYVVPPDQLDLALQVEAERLTSARFQTDQLATYAKKCRTDLDAILKSAHGSLVNYGLMALNQALYYGKTSIPIYRGTDNITVANLEKFHADYYRPDDMVIVVVGDFDSADATTAVKKRFDNIAPRKAPKESRKAARGAIDARWDIPANAFFLAFPGPYQDDKERLSLMMFGAFLNQSLLNDPEITKLVKSSYCSNQAYPVGTIPFFVFLEAQRGRVLSDVQATAIVSINDALDKITPNFFEAMKFNLTSFVENSLLDSRLNSDVVPYFQTIGQEALDIGIKHFLLNGRSREEFTELVKSITYEEAGQYLKQRLTVQKMVVVTLHGQAEE